MITLQNISFTYKSGEGTEGLSNVNISIPEGQVVLFCGESGCGKTTLTRLVNGLIPHYFEGELTGEVLIDGKNPAVQPIQKTAHMVGSVFQNPRSQYFTVDSTSELAFGCENKGWPPEKIASRMQQVNAQFGLEKLLDRNLFKVSGVEKQKIACASVTMPEPQVYVLDEPSSNLDIRSINELAAIIAKWKQEGKTILVAEHRLHYLMGIADRIIYMNKGEIHADMPASEFKLLSENRLHKMGLRSLFPVSFTPEPPPDTPKMYCREFYLSRSGKEVLNMDVEIPEGSIVAILGNNGAGKTTFARCLCGLEKKAKGTLSFKGKIYRNRQRLSSCYIVMQDVNHQLFTESVLDEVEISIAGTQEKEKIRDKAERILRQFDLSEVQTRHPQSLSGGQKQRVAIAGAVASEKEILIFDEPTSGLDYRHMLEVAQSLKRLSAAGKTQFIITHDPELVKYCCNYVIFMENGSAAWKGVMNDEVIKHLENFFDFPTFSVV